MPRIRSVDLSRAAAAPGVALALSGADLMRLLPPVPDTQLSLPSKWTTRVQHEFHNPQQPLLAHDKVRHVGEAIAVIVAESRYAAEDAAALVTAELDELPAVVRRRSGARGRARRSSTSDCRPTFSARSRSPRAMPMPRWPAPRTGCSAAFIITATPRCRWSAAASSPLYDPRTNSMTIWSATQVVHWVRREAAAILGLPEARVRCLALDVGGGFGAQGPCLSRGSADPVSRAPARAAGALDRGPAAST